MHETNGLFLQTKLKRRQIAVKVMPIPPRQMMDIATGKVTVTVSLLGVPS